MYSAYHLGQEERRGHNFSFDPEKVGVGVETVWSSVSSTLEPVRSAMESMVPLDRHNSGEEDPNWIGFALPVSSEHTKHLPFIRVILGFKLEPILKRT